MEDLMILVTGGYGFLGTALVRTLVQMGEKVLSISRKPRPAQGFESAVCDVRDKDSLISLFDNYPITSIVHLVSLLITNSNNYPDQAIRINVVGTLHLLEISRERGIKRFIYGSSYNAVGYRPLNKCPIDETSEPTPDDFYGETKRFNEKLCISFKHLFGIESASARMPILVGPGAPVKTSTWRADIFNMIKSGGKINISFNPNEVIPIAHITDTAEAIAQMVLAPRLKHNIYYTPSESMKVEKLGKFIENINPSIKVKYGKKLLRDMPPKVDCSRIIKEFNLHPVSLFKRLQCYQGNGD